MPVYESIKNADNKIVISAASKDSVVFGWDNVIAKLASLVDGNKNIALDGWYGIAFEKIAKALAESLKAKGIDAKLKNSDFAIYTESGVKINLFDYAGDGKTYQTNNMKVYNTYTTLRYNTDKYLHRTT